MSNRGHGHVVPRPDGLRARCGGPAICPECALERVRLYQATQQGGAVTEKPTVGRIVHYTNLGDADGRYPPEQQAAIVTGVNADGTAALHIFYKTGQFDMPAVPFSAEYKRGHWTWPPRT